MENLITSICKSICYNQSILFNKDCANFVVSQVNISPFHIKNGLRAVALLFFILSVFYGLGTSFLHYNSEYKKNTFIEFFEDLSKTTRMFISFIRSMSLIYLCDNNLL